MCHELRTWRNSGQAHESRRDLWQEFEDTTRQDDAQSTDPPQPTETERSDETVKVGA